MKLTTKILLALSAAAWLLGTAAPASASATMSFYKEDVTKAEPLDAVGTVTVAGDVSGRAVGSSKGFTLYIDGPAGFSCSDHSNRYAEAYCILPNAPVGDYRVRVIPDGKAIATVRVYATAEAWGLP